LKWIDRTGKRGVRKDSHSFWLLTLSKENTSVSERAIGTSQAN
jgi:hypothetical protein